MEHRKFAQEGVPKEIGNVPGVERVKLDRQWEGEKWEASEKAGSVGWTSQRDRGAGASTCLSGLRSPWCCLFLRKRMAVCGWRCGAPARRRTTKPGGAGVGVPVHPWHRSVCFFSASCTLSLNEFKHPLPLHLLHPAVGQDGWSYFS